MNYSIPILLYHRIENSLLSTATPPEVFRRHLAWLRDRGWRSLSLDEFSFVMKTGKRMPYPAFLITFDDGYENISSVALDILKEFDFKAISFLSTQFLEDAYTHPDSSVEGSEKKSYLSWNQVRELQASGIVDCQSHTHTHQNFSNCSIAEIEQDLVTSVDLLSYELHLPKSHFTHLAWPWGVSMPTWRSIAKRCGFIYQYTVSRQACMPASSREQIPRTCFDAVSLPKFQRQIWLQSGNFSMVWNIVYPLGRKVRHLSLSALSR